MVHFCFLSKQGFCLNINPTTIVDITEPTDKAIPL